MRRPGDKTETDDNDENDDDDDDQDGGILMPIPDLANVQVWLLHYIKLTYIYNI